MQCCSLCPGTCTVSSMGHGQGSVELLLCITRSALSVFVSPWWNRQAHPRPANLPVLPQPLLCTLYTVPLHAKTCSKTTPITTETTTPCDKTNPAHSGTNRMPNPSSLPGHETRRPLARARPLPSMSSVTCPRGCLSIRNNLSVNFSPPSPLHRPTTPPPCRSRRD
jgi:hypothetical protein